MRRLTSPPAWLATLVLCGVSVPVQSDAVRPPEVAGFPEWLVPVVRVLDDGRVVPTTGVVVAEQTVLVPSEFTVGGDALVVLDGGPELSKHGRTATVSRRLPLAGLAVLDVTGLRRPSPRLADGPLRDGQLVLLQALAPPDLLALGEARVQRTGRLRRSGEDGVSLDSSTPLPNVTGVLVDGCGQWAGYSAARGAASMATSSLTLYQWVPALSVQLADAGIALEAGACSLDAVPPGATAGSEPGSSPASGEVPATDTAPTPAPAGDTASVPAAGDEVDERPRERDLPELVPDPAPFPAPRAEAPPASGAPADPVTEAPGALRRVAPWLLGALVLALIGLGLRRLRRAPASATERAAFVLESETRRLLVPARGGRVDCTLGRYDVDVVIEAVAVSRRHARLFGTPERLQLMDLGSTNGTWVNGRPCAANVAVAVNPGDQLRFGDQEFTLQPAAGVGA